MAGTMNIMVGWSKVVWHYFRMMSDGDSGVASMIALRDLGDVSLPMLRHGIRQKEQPLIQLRSAVVLHWLGQREGLPVMVDILRYTPPSKKGFFEEIRRAFALVGAPDATRALIDLWRQLPALDDRNPLAILIVSIWQEIKDPAMLDCLCDSSVSLPILFEDTCKSFGEESLPALRRLSTDRDGMRRCMALRGLSRIKSPVSSSIITPLLRDPDAAVREQAATALENTCSTIAYLNALVSAHRDGFSSQNSVKALVFCSPPDLYAYLAGLLTRYVPTRRGEPEVGDSAAAVAEAVSAMQACPWPNAQVTQLLCGLLDRPVCTEIRTSVALSISARGPSGDDSDLQAKRAMWAQLICADTSARRTAAESLASFGDPIGLQFENLIESGRPQGSLLKKLQDTLLSTQDVSQAVTQAVQQVASWVTRVSRETTERYMKAAPASGSTDLILADARLPGMLERLLSNTLDSIDLEFDPDLLVDYISSGVAILRAIGRLNVAAAIPTEQLVKRAFVMQKRLQTPTRTRSVRTNLEDVAHILRVNAGQTLVEIYGPKSFSVLMDGVNHTDQAVQISSIVCLGKLGDPRAVPVLQEIIERGAPALTQSALDATATIKRSNPEMMTLLRGSSAENAQTEMLLRPSTNSMDASSPETLLRSSAPNE